MIGEINCHSLLQDKYILTTTDYFTKGVEYIPLTQINEKVVIDFIEKHLIARFGVPSIIVFDNDSHFSSLKLFEFSLNKGIILR